MKGHGQGKKNWYEQNGNITRNVHVKYENLVGSEVMDKLKVFVTDEWDLMSSRVHKLSHMASKSGQQKEEFGNITCSFININNLSSIITNSII